MPETLKSRQQGAGNSDFATSNPNHKRQIEQRLEKESSPENEHHFDKESTPEKQSDTGLIGSQTPGTGSTGSPTGMSDQELEKMRQQENAYREQRLQELRDELQQLKDTSQSAANISGQHSDSPAVPSSTSSEPDDDRDYSQGYGY